APPRFRAWAGWTSAISCARSHAGASASSPERGPSALAVGLSARPGGDVRALGADPHRRPVARDPAPAVTVRDDGAVTSDLCGRDLHGAGEIGAAIGEALAVRQGTAIGARRAGRDLHEPDPPAAAALGAGVPGAFVLGQRREEAGPEGAPLRHRGLFVLRAELVH